MTSSTPRCGATAERSTRSTPITRAAPLCFRTWQNSKPIGPSPSTAHVWPATEPSRSTAYRTQASGCISTASSGGSAI